MVNLPIFFLLQLKIIDSATAIVIGLPLTVFTIVAIFYYQEGGWEKVKKELWDINMSLGL